MTSLARNVLAPAAVLVVILATVALVFGKDQDPPAPGAVTEPRQLFPDGSLSLGDAATPDAAETAPDAPDLTDAPDTTDAPPSDSLFDLGTDAS